MRREPRWRPSLRRPAVALAVALGLLTAAACGDDDADDPESSPESVWTFADDAGEEIALDAPPERIVMFEDVAASLMDLGVRPVGLHYINGVGGNRLFEGTDLEGIETVGTVCEELNLEALAALEPDLIVYMLWGEETFCLTPEQVPLVEEIAPLVQIQAVGESDAIRDRYLDLAEALGADLESDEIAAKRSRFEAAAQRLESVVAARPEISVLPVSIAPDYVGMAEPSAYPDLVTLRDRYGVRFVGPFDPNAPSTDTYWEELSSETIADHRGDVILIDAKNETPLQAKLDAFPLWAALPEVQARQLVDWWVPGSFSFSRDAEFLESLADAIEQAQDLVPD